MRLINCNYMKAKILILSLMGISLLTSCSKHSEERAWEQQHKNDSMAYAVVSKVDARGALAIKLKIERAKYDKAKYDYDNARDQLRTIEEFHLARSNKNKQLQIQQQNSHIEDLKDSMDEIAEDISRLEKKVARK